MLLPTLHTYVRAYIQKPGVIIIETVTMWLCGYACFVKYFPIEILIIKIVHWCVKENVEVFG